MGFDEGVAIGERQGDEGTRPAAQPPYLRFKPPVSPLPPPRPFLMAFRGRRAGAVVLMLAALVAHLLGLYCLYELSNFAMEAWFYEWTGYYDLAASAVGVVAAACVLNRSGRPIVLAGTAMLIIAGILDTGMDGTKWVGMVLIALSVMGGLIWSLPSIDRSLRGERPATSRPGSPTVAAAVASQEGLYAAEGVASAAGARHWTGGRWRLIGAVLLVLAAIAILPSCLLYLGLSLWYHASEGYLEVYWDVFWVGLYELASVIMGLVAARYTLKGPRPPVGLIASAIAVGNVFLWWYPAMWGGYLSDYPLATLACFVLGVPSAVLQLLMAGELRRLGPPEAPGAVHVPPVVMGARGPIVQGELIRPLDWRRVALVVLTMMLVGPSLSLVVTHEHIVGEVVEAGEDAETGWGYFIVETQDYDSYFVFNRFPNSPAYHYAVGDHFDEWVPDACWFRY